MILNTILDKDQYYHVFQPLYFLPDWKKLGNEILLRSKLIANPEDVFSFAKKTGNLYELDTYALFSALSTFAKCLKGTSDLIFVNVLPSSLLNPSFFFSLDNFLNRISIPCHKIVFEVNESERIENLNLFRTVINHLRNYGFLIAIDDFGKGEADIQKIIELEPQFIKLDRYFSINLFMSTQKQRFIQLMIDFCKGSSQVILEGIEKSEDLAIAKMLGVPIAQGFLLGKPDLLENIYDLLNTTARFVHPQDVG